MSKLNGDPKDMGHLGGESRELGLGISQVKGVKGEVVINQGRWEPGGLRPVGGPVDLPRATKS